MSKFTDRELAVTQIAGIAVFILGFTLGVIGAICLKAEIGLPEYIIGVRNTGWTLTILSFTWTGIATWRRMSK